MAKTKSATLSKAMCLICDLCIELNEHPVNKYSGCWEHAVDGKWWIALNGHEAATECSRISEPVPPCTAYVEYLGVPVGLITPRSGSGLIVAGYENKLIVALEKKIARVRTNAAQPQKGIRDYE